ncbi:nicotinamide-nucleotide amidohydrolase family protein [Micrococcales bacterium 31B]|nr:nicotinamide-nucleotide amidohydrolase family protein [Micrococcales bacterium 31B]
MPSAGAVPRASGLVAELARRGETLATCESLTGGQVAALIVDVPGASAVFRGGLVTYAVELKSSLAGVDPGHLAAEGPVNHRTAREMAVGAARACGAAWGVATTGVAGPEAHGGCPVGTVFIGVARVVGPDAEWASWQVSARDTASRAAVRESACEAACGALEAALAGDWDPTFAA